MDKQNEKEVIEFKAKFEELVGDEHFRAKLKGVKNRDEIKRLFAENGLDLPEEVLDASVKEIERIDETGELDEKALEFVSGGWSWGAFFTGAIVGGGMGFIAGNGAGAIAGAVISAIACGIMG